MGCGASEAALALSLGAASVRVCGGCLALYFDAALDLSVGHRKHLAHGILKARERLRAFDIFRFGLHVSIMAHGQGE